MKNNSNHTTMAKLTKLQEALLYMATIGLYPHKPHTKSFFIVTGFIEKDGEYYCDSISEIVDALYKMSWEWMGEEAYIDGQGSMREQTFIDKKALFSNTRLPICHIPKQDYRRKVLTMCYETILLKN